MELLGPLGPSLFKKKKVPGIEIEWTPWILKV
jgi:hypothetical protein